MKKYTSKINKIELAVILPLLTIVSLFQELHTIHF